MATQAMTSTRHSARTSRIVSPRKCDIPPLEIGQRKRPWPVLEAQGLVAIPRVSACLFNQCDDGAAAKAIPGLKRRTVT
jgi:hypothetical protein